MDLLQLEKESLFSFLTYIEPRCILIIEGLCIDEKEDVR